MSIQGLLTINLIVISICNFVVIGSQYGPNQEIFGRFIMIASIIGAGAAVILLYIVLAKDIEAKENNIANQ